MKLIAETAWHHDGDFEFMQNLIDKLINETKADVIKLHLTLNFEEYMAKDHPAYSFLKQRLFSKKKWEAIINKIKHSDKKLMLLMNDTEAVKFGMDFTPYLIEIHSVCLNDIHLLKELKKQNLKPLPVVLGVGGSTLYEIENAISLLNTPNIILMHGFQNYPTDYKDINFKKIKKIMQIYQNYKHGYADHTAWDEPNNILITNSGAALGMDYIEKHITIVPGEERTDWQAAVSIDIFNQIADDLKIIKACNGNGELRLNEGEKAYSVFGPNKKAAILRVQKYKGETLQAKDFMLKRTAIISETSQLKTNELIGKKCNCDLMQNSIINKKDWY